MAPDEIWDVVGRHGASLFRGVVKQQAVIDPAQVLVAVVLHGNDVMSATSELLCHRRGDHLVEQQPHSSRACSASYRPRNSAASCRRTSIWPSISSRNAV